MSKQTLIVIGNGMVGHHFLEQFAETPAAAGFQVTVFGEEKQLAYDRVHLSEYFTGSTHNGPPPTGSWCWRLVPMRSPRPSTAVILHIVLRTAPWLSSAPSAPAPPAPAPVAWWGAAGCDWTPPLPARASPWSPTWWSS